MIILLDNYYGTLNPIIQNILMVAICTVYLEKLIMSTNIKLKSKFAARDKNTVTTFLFTG